MTNHTSTINNQSDFSANARLLVNFFAIVFVLICWLVSTVTTYSLVEYSPSGSVGETVFFSIMIGIFFSRWAIVALLVVLLPGKLIFRIAIASLIFFAETMLLINLTHTLEPWILVLLLPTIVLGFAIPFEFARVLWDCRLDVDWFDNAERKPLSIKQLFFRVTAIAILLGLMRMAAENGEAIIGLATSGVSISIVCAGFLLPLTLRFASGQQKFLWTAIFLLSVIVATAGLMLALVALFDGDITAEPVVAIPSALGAMLAGYVLVLALLSRLGFDLKVGTRRRPVSG